MSVEIQYSGRLGNQLFQYAFGRIVAEHFGYALDCYQHDFGNVDELTSREFFGRKLDCGVSATLDELGPFFADAPQHLPGRRVESPERRIIHSEPIVEGGPRWNGQDIDLSALLADRSDRRLVFCGYFQRFDYYRSHIDKIRRWFAFEPLPDVHGITKNDLFLHIRRGADYAHAGFTLSLGAHLRLLGQIDYARLFVAGTGIDENVRASLAPFSPIYAGSTAFDDFRFMTRFNKIIQSNSTFSWWASFLSQAEEIYTPLPDRNFPGVDLATGESRYRYFDALIAEFVPFAPNPSAKKRILAEGEASALVIETATGPETRITVTADTRKFFEWFVDRREPFGLAQVLGGRLLARDLVERVMEQLAASGAITIAEHFVEK
jgi:hypothetical protein